MESEDRASPRAHVNGFENLKIGIKAQKEPAVLYYINKAYLTGVKNQRTLMATENMMIFWVKKNHLGDLSQPLIRSNFAES